MKKFYWINYRAAQKGESGEAVGKNYTLDHACQACGTGAEFTDFYPAKGLSNIKENFFYTLDWDYIISQKLYDSLTQEYNIHVSQLLPVKNPRGQVLPYYWFHSWDCFPKMDAQSEGVIIDERFQCPICRKNGYFGEPSKLSYTISNKDLLLEKDLFMTWEHWGCSGLKEEGDKVIRFARRHPLVSEKIKDAFEKVGVKKAVFQEVFIK